MMRVLERTRLVIPVSVHPMVTLLLFGLLLRLSLAAIDGFRFDIEWYHTWSIQLAHHAPWDFYRADLFSDYTPGYLYVLLLLGRTNLMFDFTAEQFEYI